VNSPTDGVEIHESRAGLDLRDFGHDPQEVALRLVRAFIDQLGGVETFRWMYKYYVKGHSYREISNWAGVPVSTLRNRIRKGAEIMDRYDLMPPEWKEKDEKRRVAMKRERE
jgi:hypothetical protein